MSNPNLPERSRRQSPAAPAQPKGESPYPLGKREAPRYPDSMFEWEKRGRESFFSPRDRRMFRWMIVAFLLIVIIGFVMARGWYVRRGGETAPPPVTESTEPPANPF